MYALPVMDSLFVFGKLLVVNPLCFSPPDSFLHPLNFQPLKEIPLNNSNSASLLFAVLKTLDLLLTLCFSNPETFQYITGISDPLNTCLVRDPYTLCGWHACTLWGCGGNGTCGHREEQT